MAKKLTITEQLPKGTTMDFEGDVDAQTRHETATRERHTIRYAICNDAPIGLSLIHI